MTTLHQIELACPVCRLRFASHAVVSTDSSGGKRTDFHERALGSGSTCTILLPAGDDVDRSEA